MSDENLTKYCKLRQIQKDDLDTLLVWRNSKPVRESMRNSDPIGSESHQSWFQNKVQQSPNNYWIFEYKDIPYGYMSYIDIINEPSTTVEWGFYLGPEARPQGLGRCLGILGIRKAQEIGKSVLIGQVKSENSRSIDFHLKLDFKEVSSSDSEYRKFLLNLNEQPQSGS